MKMIELSQFWGCFVGPVRVRQLRGKAFASARVLLDSRSSLEFIFAADEDSIHLLTECISNDRIFIEGYRLRGRLRVHTVGRFERPGETLKGDFLVPETRH